MSYQFTRQKIARRCFLGFCSLGTVCGLSEADLRAYLAAMRASQKHGTNIEPAGGEFLAENVRRLRARRVLEIGTFNGYSAVWMAMALPAGGKLITIESDQGRYDLAQANFKVSGILPLVDSRLANPASEVRGIPPPLDLVFLNGRESDFSAHYQLVIPKVRKSGLVIAHNATARNARLRGFPDRIHSDATVRTEIHAVGAHGFSVSTKLV